jgi:integrase/recombinase XerD
MSSKQEQAVQHRPWTPESEREFTANAIQGAPAACQAALREYALWLEEDRGLRPGSITLRVASARSFVCAVTKGEATVAAAFGKLEARGVEDWFVSYCRDHGPGARRSMQATMRSFLGFAATRGWSASELIQAVPRLRTYGLRHVPKGASEEDIGRLLRSVSAEGVSARDRAIVFLLVGYGVRRGQVTALQLDDLDWRERTIRFAPHKGGKEVRHALTAAVAVAVSGYLRHERPASDSRSVFLRRRAPHLPLSPGALTQMIHDRVERLGIGGMPRGPHSLRHAFATRLVRGGQPLKSIADLLGHRSLSATAIYAKVDHPRLFEVAAEWPEVLS